MAGYWSPIDRLGRLCTARLNIYICPGDILTIDLHPAQLDFTKHASPAPPELHPDQQKGSWSWTLGSNYQTQTRKYELSSQLETLSREQSWKCRQQKLMIYQTFNIQVLQLADEGQDYRSRFSQLIIISIK